MQFKVTDPDRRSKDGQLQFAASSMQGRRATMEDAHTIVTDVDGLPGHAFVAVYDGHVRATCAEYAGKEMLSILRTTAEFRQYCKQRGGSDGGSGGGDADASALLGGALRSAFIKMDEALRHLQKHGQPPPSSSGGADPGAAATLPRRLAAALLRALAAAPHDLAPRRKVGGCTALCALVTPRAVVLAHAGDARAIVCAGGGVVAATKDHKPHDPAECARIVAAGGFVRSSRVDGNLAISRALGDFDFKDASLPPQDCKVTCIPDITVHVRRPDDELLLLCCDGVWDCCENEVFRLQAMSVLSNKGLPLGACCEELLDQCYHMGSMDNMTIVMVAFPGLKRGRLPASALPPPPADPTASTASPTSTLSPSATSSPPPTSAPPAEVPAPLNSTSTLPVSPPLLPR